MDEKLNEIIKQFNADGNSRQVEFVIRQRANELITKHPKIKEWIMKDALIKNWYELYIRSDKTLPDGLIILAELLLQTKDFYFGELLELHQTHTFKNFFPLSV